MIACAIGSFAISFAIMSRCTIEVRQAPLMQLQESILVTGGAALPAEMEDVIMPRTKLCSSAIAALCYVLAIGELLQLWLDAAEWPRALRAIAFLTIGIATEIEAGLKPPASARLPSKLWWRGRALVRFASACALAAAHSLPILEPGWEMQPVSGYSADWQWVDLVFGGCTALLAGAIALAFVAGPPLLVPAPSPPPPMQVAWLLPKTLYLFWTPVMLGLYRRIITKPDDPLSVDSLPCIDPTIAAASAWAEGTTSRARREAKQRKSNFEAKQRKKSNLVVSTESPLPAAPAPASLLPEVWLVVRLDAIIQFLWCFAVVFLEYAAPFGMLGLIGYIQSNTGGAVPPSAIFFGACVALGPLALNTCHGQANASGWRTGTKLRAYFTRAVCEKALRFDSAASSQSIGLMTNLLAVDTQNIVDFAGWAAWLWLEGMQLAMTLAALFYLLGYAAFGGLGVCLFAFPLNAVVMRQVKILQDRLMGEKDKRMALITEAIGAIRAIKLHAWEDEFERRIAKLRHDEVATLLAYQKLNAITSTMWLTTPTTAALASFLIKSRLIPPYRITAAEGFTALTLFQLLSVSLTFLPYMINSAIQANVGLRRISRFLALDDVEGRDHGLQLGIATGEVVVQEASFKWTSPPPEEKEQRMEKKDTSAKGRRRWGMKWGSSQRAQTEGTATSTTAPLLASATPPVPTTLPVSSMTGSSTDGIQPMSAATTPSVTLSNVSLAVRPGELAIICGPTGCGKSSLLAAMLGDMPQLGGLAAIRGKISYCPQRSWLANASLRENILFGSKFESSRYEAVLDACALRADIALLPNGDATEIGERGINLSGGQQQRVNLARACYADTDVVLLDDVLSAVDAHVGAHIFDQCILGFLTGRTRVLVTHSDDL